MIEQEAQMKARSLTPSKNRKKNGNKNHITDDYNDDDDSEYS